MNNNGLIEYKENFITKIKNFFKRLFGRKNEQYSNIQEISSNSINESINNEKKDKFITEIRVDDKEINNVVKKDNFLKEIEGNEEKLNMLSIDRLKKLEKYYDNVIAENDKKIKKLKATA